MARVPMVLCRLCPQDATMATKTQLSAPATCHCSPTLARAVCSHQEGRSDGAAPPHSLEASAPSKAPVTPRMGPQCLAPRTGARISGRPSSRGDERFDHPPDLLDATSRACGPWLTAPSIRGSPLEAPGRGSPAGIAMRASPRRHRQRGTREAGYRAGPERGCCWMPLPGDPSCLCLWVGSKK